MRSTLLCTKRCFLEIHGGRVLKASPPRPWTAKNSENMTHISYLFWNVIFCFMIWPLEPWNLTHVSELFFKGHILFHGLATKTVKQVAGKWFHSTTTVLLYDKKLRFIGSSIKHHSVHSWDIQSVKLFHSILQHIIDSQATVCGWWWKQIKALG